MVLENLDNDLCPCSARSKSVFLLNKILHSLPDNEMKKGVLAGFLVEKKSAGILEPEVVVGTGMLLLYCFSITI